MTDDIVAELERWLGYTHFPGRVALQRARDEIVALRAYRHENPHGVRIRALEEAARVCELMASPDQDELVEALNRVAIACAAAIRSLR